ncbi:uncharacterized protein B0I36DRAFT_354090 [Microdochium trichocladiopsis]|uniref:Uncharacterized protein n=1 Tax=Microdochium trichocladiopsis TaxID=1682393 RepID=A0A9P9BIC2_9PEZI|nr:uncharacterized protein B0I36DRAFT_354090 [Microdochium trichocladiopsis]KAH7021430.1 hypothetical protein B0I36DRAFT_354090 [Microdochium trichocladiopsis]
MAFPFGNKKKSAAATQASDDASVLVNVPKEPGKLKTFMIGTFGCFFPDGASVIGEAPKAVRPVVVANGGQGSNAATPTDPVAARPGTSAGAAVTTTGNGNGNVARAPEELIAFSNILAGVGQDGVGSGQAAPQQAAAAANEAQASAKVDKGKAVDVKAK